jgi:hypothetical protein
MRDTISPSAHHTRDLRKGRFSETGLTYLITTVVHNRRPLFSEWPIGRLLADELRATENFGLVQSLAWVVMPDHLHWLITCNPATCLLSCNASKVVVPLPSIARLAAKGKFGRKVSMTTPCARMRMCKQLRGTSSPTRFVQDWSKGLGTIRCGMRIGFRGSVKNQSPAPARSTPAGTPLLRSDPSAASWLLHRRRSL